MFELEEMRVELVEMEEVLDGLTSHYANYNKKDLETRGTLGLKWLMSLANKKGLVSVLGKNILNIINNYNAIDNDDWLFNHLGQKFH